MAGARPFEARGEDGNVLRGEAAGSGPAIIEAHGLTATRRYVTHGSHALERAGFECFRYDARGHGESDPAANGETYEYAALARDMAALADEVRPAGRVLLAGHSMGAHTAAAFALSEPERIAGLVVIGPVSRGEAPSEDTVAYWDRLAEGLENGGVDGFIAAYDDGSHNPEWRDVILRLARQRLSLHAHPEAVAVALREVTRSLPFEGLGALERLELPVLVVASRDDADPGHPWAVAEEWSRRIPGARMISEGEGESPLAWQGGKLSREITEFCAEPRVADRLGLG